METERRCRECNRKIPPGTGIQVLLFGFEFCTKLCFDSYPDPDFTEGYKRKIKEDEKNGVIF